MPPAKGCGSEASIVRRGSSKDGATKPIAVAKVLTPPTSSTTKDPSDLRVLELASKIQGPDVKVGLLALADGYTVLGADTLNAEQKDAVEVEARIESQTGALGKLVLTDKDQQLCAADLNVGVFSKHPKRFLGFLWKTGDWVLSGMVSGASAPTKGEPDLTPPNNAGCSAGPWTAAALSAQSDWLARKAPVARRPRRAPGSGNSGVSTKPKAALQACALVTPTLPEVKTGTPAPRSSRRRRRTRN